MQSPNALQASRQIPPSSLPKSTSSPLVQNANRSALGKKLNPTAIEGTNGSSGDCCKLLGFRRPNPILRKRNSLKCFCQDNAVQPHRPIADVPRLHLNAFIDAHMIAPIHLPKSGQARSGRQDRGKVHAHAASFPWKIGTRSDETHFSFQNVAELWQLVQAPTAQETAQAGEARIIAP